MKKLLIMLIVLFLITGCAAQPQEEQHAPSQSVVKWDEISYDWVMDKGYHNALGAEPYAISGHYPLTFFSSDGLFSFVL